MIFLGLLSAFAFLGAAESADSKYLLTIVYNTSIAGRNSSQTFYIPLDDFSAILDNISKIVKGLPVSAANTQLLNTIGKLQGAIPKLAENPNDPVALTGFSKDLLNLLRGLNASPDKALQEIFLQLVSSFLTKPSDAATTPKPLTDPEADALKAQFEKLVTALNTLVNGGDPIVAEDAKKILDQINNLANATDLWTALIEILKAALRLARTADNNPNNKKVAGDVISLVLSILAKLPSSKTDKNGLAALLVTLLANIAQKDKTEYNAAYNAISSLSGTGKDSIQALVGALNVIIKALSKNLPDPLKSLFTTLTDQLRQFAKDGKNVPQILDTLQKLVDEALKNTGATREEAKSLLGIILNVLKPLLGNVPATNAALQKLIDQLNLKPPPQQPSNGDSSCNTLIPALICVVQGLLGNLLGGSSGGSGGDLLGLGSLLRGILG